MASTNWTAADLPDLSGRTAVVTGASSGIGVFTATELARAGARVILAVRNTAKGETVARNMSGNAEVRPLDLTNLASVRAFADSWSGDLDILINNAGVMLVPQGRTADGFEVTIGTNHLGHFALTNLLLAHITDRVVTVSSPLGARGHVDVDDLNWERRRYNTNRAYADSKQANLLFTAELQRRLTAAGSPVRALSAHPGISNTNLGSHGSGARAVLSTIVFRVFGQPAQQGALPTLYAATQDLPGTTYAGPGGPGHLRGRPEVIALPRSAQDPELARRLWDRSAELTGVDSAWPTQPNG